MKAFEDLTNEILVEVNKLCDPHFLDANYMAQVLMGAIHAYDHKIGMATLEELFESCVNRISCHVTYHAVQEIQNKLKLDGGLKPALVPDENDLTDEPVGHV